MEVRSVSSILGFLYDTMIVEKRSTFDYDNGNDVTIVEQRSYTVQLYSSKGTLENFSNPGQVIDQKI